MNKRREIISPKGIEAKDGGINFNNNSKSTYSDGGYQRK